jgi:hypothetical protein
VAPSWDAEAKTFYGYASYGRLLCHDGIRGAAAETAATTRSRGEGGDTVYFLTVSRTVSFMLPTAFCILPAAFSAFPSASVFWSPKTFPTTSLTLPTTCLDGSLNAILIHDEFSLRHYGRRGRGPARSDHSRH